MASHKHITVRVIQNILDFLEPKEDITLKILAIEKNDRGRYLSFYLQNTNLLGSKWAIRGIFNTLMNNDAFLNFGYRKIILTTAIIYNANFAYHHNMLITNDFTFEEFYAKVEKLVKTHYEDGYPVEIIPIFKVRVWNFDISENANIKVQPNNIFIKKNFNRGNQRYYSTHSFKNRKKTVKKYDKEVIEPLITDDKIDVPISALDIETITMHDDVEIPISIAITGRKVRKFFLIDQNLLKSDLDKAVQKLWEEFWAFICLNPEEFKIIFAHNFGSFDGYFILFGLSLILEPSQIKGVIDEQNKIIWIEAYLDSNKKGRSKNKVIFKDSYRIFPLSLENLCKTYGVEGKLGKYNPKFHQIDFFNNPNLFKTFKEYAIQDAEALLAALNVARKWYFKMFKVDLASIVSTSSLSLKIFRKHYLKHKIPILSEWLDSFIRRAYYGGGVDYYKKYGENLYYYDVNSLYPFAMLKPMPYEKIKTIPDMSNINLNDFFGFCLAEIECPKDIIRPLLIHKHEGKSIHPTGKWLGVYFSEELKAVIPYGYKVKLIKGEEFSKINLFDEYIKYFYEKKRTAKTASERLIYKFLLNTLYGIFGRSLETLETKSVYTKDLSHYLTSRVVKTLIKINDYKHIVLMVNNLNSDLIDGLNDNYTDVTAELIFSPIQQVKSNVALSAAVTAYGRIHMMRFKLDDSSYYTDTDSIFLDKPLDPKYLGDDLGLMKDELSGKVIDEAYFLGIKQYGYTYYENNRKIEKSVFAGVTRNSLSFDDIKNISQGGIIEKIIPVRFYKSLENLSITIKSSKTTIRLNHDKDLIKNRYIPLHVNDLNHELDTRTFVSKLKARFLKFRKILYFLKK